MYLYSFSYGLRVYAFHWRRIGGSLIRNHPPGAVFPRQSCGQAWVKRQCHHAQNEHRPLKPENVISLESPAAASSHSCHGFPGDRRQWPTCSVLESDPSQLETALNIPFSLTCGTNIEKRSDVHSLPRAMRKFDNLLPRLSIVFVPRHPRGT
jgi:hypothetical protein